MKKMISRRNFLKACAIAGSAAALTACGGGAPPPTPPRRNPHGPQRRPGAVRGV